MERNEGATWNREFHEEEESVRKLEEVENPMVLPEPNYSAPKYRERKLDMTEHCKTMDRWNEEAARRFRERGDKQ